MKTFSALSLATAFSLTIGLTAYAVEPSDFANMMTITASDAAPETAVEGVPVLIRLSDTIPGFRYADVAANGTCIVGALRELFVGYDAGNYYPLRAASSGTPASITKMSPPSICAASPVCSATRLTSAATRMAGTASASSLDKGDS